jgi:hypothetical protein
LFLVVVAMARPALYSCSSHWGGVHVDLTLKCNTGVKIRAAISSSLPTLTASGNACDRKWCCRFPGIS